MWWGPRMMTTPKKPSEQLLRKLTLRVSPSEARDIDAFLRTAKPTLDHESRSRAGVVRTALLSFLRGDFDPFPTGSGHADWSERWGRMLPRPDTLSKTVVKQPEPLTIRVTIRLPRVTIADVDAAVKRRDFGSRASFVRAVLSGYLSWRSSRPDTLVKTTYPPTVSSVGSHFSVYSSGGNVSDDRS